MNGTLVQPANPRKTTMADVEVGDRIGHPGDSWWRGTVIAKSYTNSHGIYRLALDDGTQLVTHDGAPVVVMAKAERLYCQQPGCSERETFRIDVTGDGGWKVFCARHYPLQVPPVCRECDERLWWCVPYQETGSAHWASETNGSAGCERKSRNYGEPAYGPHRPATAS